METKLLAALTRGGGLVTAQDLHEVGVGPRLLAAWLHGRVLVPVRRGVYTTPELWDSWDIYRARPLARIRAASRALQIPHVFSHDSAALLHGLPLLRPQHAAVHVTQRHLRGSRTKGGVRHHGARYAAHQVVEVEGLRTLDRPRTVVDITREHGYRAGLVAADGAMQQGVSRSELAAAAGAMAGWPHSLRVGAVIEDADPGAESASETLLRELLVEMGLGPIETQFPVQIPGGIAWVDIRVGCHGFESDGKVKILPVAEGGVAEEDPTTVLWEERKRQHHVCAQGMGMSRVTYDDYWGEARERAKARIAAEYAVTVRRFGTELPVHLERFAASVRGRRYKTPG